jgi:Fe-S-cluster containining protein
MAPAAQTYETSQAFGYVCRRCTRCCRNNDIRVNPYEVARLAAHLGLTTAAFRASRTREGAGILLQHTNTGACTFLSEETGGCRVHPDRPLVCRVFPLGRELLADGSERYFASQGVAAPGGDFTREGTIGSFIEAQGVPPFARASDGYFGWLYQLASGLNTDSFVTSKPDPADVTGPASALVDMDAAIAAWCTTTGTPEPDDIEARRRLHLELLNRKLDDYLALAGGDGTEQPDRGERIAALRRLLLAAGSLLAASLGVVPA